MNPKAYLCWDFDGTLAFREGLWTATLHTLLVRHGFSDIAFHEIRPFMNIGFPWHSPETKHRDILGDSSWWEYMNTYFKEVFMRVGLSENQAGQIAEQVKAEYLDLKYWKLFPDTVPVLERTLAQGFSHLILSNHVPELPELVWGLGLDEYFEAVYSSAIVGAEKPSRYFYESVLAKHVCSSTPVMIGDNYRADVAGALRAGMHAILVRVENIKQYAYYCKDLKGIVGLISEQHWFSN